MSSLLVNPTKERRKLWLRKTRIQPLLYWNRMLPGLPHEGRHLRPLAPLVQTLRLDDREPAEAPTGASQDHC